MKGTAMKDDPIIKRMAEEIVEICSPFQIFLVSYKTNSRKELTSFKLCVIADDKYENHTELETEILLKTDCPVPCDVIVYTVSDWNECLDDDCTFAYRVDNEGNLLYEQVK